jgi:hypothetical protein
MPRLKFPTGAKEREGDALRYKTATPKREKESQSLFALMPPKQEKHFRFLGNAFSCFFTSFVATLLFFSSSNRNLLFNSINCSFLKTAY